MRAMLTCKEFDEFMLDYLEGNLPLWQKSMCWLHVHMCRECAYYIRQYRRVTELGRNAYTSGDDPIPDSVPEDLIQAALNYRKRK